MPKGVQEPAKRQGLSGPRHTVGQGQGKEAHGMGWSRGLRPRRQEITVYGATGVAWSPLGQTTLALYPEGIEGDHLVTVDTRGTKVDPFLPRVKSGVSPPLAPSQFQSHSGGRQWGAHSECLSFRMPGCLQEDLVFILTPGFTLVKTSRPVERYGSNQRAAGWEHPHSLCICFHIWRLLVSGATAALPAPSPTLQPLPPPSPAPWSWEQALCVSCSVPIREGNTD